MFTEQMLTALIPGLPPTQIRMLAMPWYVGHFVMTWAKHERMLADMIARIRGVDYEPLRDRLLDGQISDYEKEIVSIIALLDSENPSRELLNEVLREHILLRSLRNDVVHGFWSAIGPDDEYQLKRKVRKQKDTMRTLPLAEIEAGWRKLDELGMIVINATRAFADQPLY